MVLYGTFFEGSIDRTILGVPYKVLYGTILGATLNHLERYEGAIWNLIGCLKRCYMEPFLVH